MLKNYFWALLFTFIFTLSTANLYSQENLPNSAKESTPKNAEEKAPKTSQASVEVVFVLDTTGSMGGLIEGAKQKIWSIVNEIANGKPTPLIKVGLIAYRDKGDAYITQRYELSDDLDSIYTTLMGFQADGGGDTPEHVNQGLYEAVHKMDWSFSKTTLNIVFLVGDAPPQTNYTDDVPYLTTCKEAVKKGIIINAIRCGDMAETGKVWQEIADASEGRFMTIKQSGGMTAVSTPFDEKISQLGRQLEETNVTYGEEKKRKEAEAKAEKVVKDVTAGSIEADVARTSYKAKMASAGFRIASLDLLDLFAKNPEKLAGIPKEHLPEKLAKMSSEELQKFLQEKLQQRKKIQAELVKLAKKRESHIKEETAKSGKSDSFDEEVMDMLEEQAEDRGIDYED